MVLKKELEQLFRIISEQYHRVIIRFKYCSNNVKSIAPPPIKCFSFLLLWTKTSRNTCILCRYKRITVLSSVGVSMQHPTFGRYITRAVCWVGGWNSHWINYWLEWRGEEHSQRTSPFFLFFSLSFLFRLGRHIIPDPANHLPTSECVCSLLWHNKQSIPPSTGRKSQLESCQEVPERNKGLECWAAQAGGLWQTCPSSPCPSLTPLLFFLFASKASRREIQWCCNVTARLNRSDLACGQDLKEQFTRNSVIIHSPHAAGSSKPANFLLASQLNGNAAFSEGVRGCFKGPVCNV